MKSISLGRMFHDSSAIPYKYSQKVPVAFTTLKFIENQDKSLNCHIVLRAGTLSNQFKLCLSVIQKHLTVLHLTCLSLCFRVLQ